MSPGDSALRSAEASPSASIVGEEQPRSFCGAKRRQGGGAACRKSAGWGTDHVGWGVCRLHSGSSATQRKHAAALEARDAAVVMGAPVDVDPHEAMLWCVQVTYGEVAYCTAQIAKLVPADAVGPVATLRHHEELDRAGDVHSLRDETSHAVALHVWIATRHGALERLAKFSKMAVDAGVAERQVKVAEQFGDQLAGMIGGLFEDLVLTADQRDRAPAIVRRHLQLAAGGADG